MITLEKIQPHLFPNLYDSFLVDDDPLSSESDWRNVFAYSWETEADHCGYAMLDDGKVVGMLGMVFCQRLIDGQSKKFCNLHTWWVREDHRGRSLGLLRPMLQLKDYTITHFTPCDKVRAISKRLGFEELDYQLRILLPQGAAKRCSEKTTRLITDEQEILSRLNDRDRKIMIDHGPYQCGHLLIEEREQSCYLLYTYVRRHRIPYCHIHYFSNKSLFLKREGLVRGFLLESSPARFAAVDSRLLRDAKQPYSFDFWAPAHALYKSTDVRPDQIDNLYSDVVFLKLTTLPDLSHAITQRLGRLWPGAWLPTRSVAASPR